MAYLKKVKTKIGDKLYWKFHHAGKPFAVPITASEEETQAAIDAALSEYSRKSKIWTVTLHTIDERLPVTKFSELVSDRTPYIGYLVGLIPGDRVEYVNENGSGDASYFLGFDDGGEPEFELEPHGMWSEMGSARLHNIFCRAKGVNPVFEKWEEETLRNIGASEHCAEYMKLRIDELVSEAENDG